MSINSELDNIKKVPKSTTVFPEVKAEVSKPVKSNEILEELVSESPSQHRDARNKPGRFIYRVVKYIKT